MLDLAGLSGSRILTVDLHAPGLARESQYWGGRLREDPTKKELWRQYVTFIEV